MLAQLCDGLLERFLLLPGQVPLRWGSMAGSSSVTGQRLTTWMKVTIALLGVYVLTLVIEVPIWLYLLIKRYGAAFAIGPGVIEAVFVALMIVFIFYGGGRGGFGHLLPIVFCVRRKRLLRCRWLVGGRGGRGGDFECDGVPGASL